MGTIILPKIFHWKLEILRYHESSKIHKRTRQRVPSTNNGPLMKKPGETERERETSISPQVKKGWKKKKTEKKEREKNRSKNRESRIERFEMVIYRERRKRDGLEIGSGVRTNRMYAGFIRATDSERRPIRRNGRAARQCVLPSTVREPRHTTRCRLRTERDASIDFSAVCGTVVECTPSNVRRGLPGKTANTVLSWETRLVDTVPSTGFPLGIMEERSRMVLFRRTPTMEFLRYISKFII